MKDKQEVSGKVANEEIIGILTAISIVSKRLAEKLAQTEKMSRAERSG